MTLIDNHNKTAKGKRILQSKGPLIIENVKNAMFLRGANASNITMEFMKDLVALKKPHATYFSKKNDLRPFEDSVPLQNFSKQHDTSLFMIGTHNKKRPHNIIMGRLFDSQVLDMVEWGIEQYKSLSHFKNISLPSGTKPMLIFNGEAFEVNDQLKRIKNILVDFFKGPDVTQVRLQGLEHIISFTCLSESQIYMRSYRTLFKKSGTKTPRVELIELGPRANLVLRRINLASLDHFKQACKKPEQIKVKKVKNKSKDPFGTKLGRIHMQKQNISKLKLRKIKGLKQTAAEKKLKTAIHIQRTKNSVNDDDTTEK